MKYNLKVEHLATGRVWIGDSDTLSPEERTLAQNLCDNISRGEVTNLTLPCGNEVVYIPKELLSGCTISLVKGD